MNERDAARDAAIRQIAAILAAAYLRLRFPNLSIRKLTVPRIPASASSARRGTLCTSPSATARTIEARLEPSGDPVILVWPPHIGAVMTVSAHFEGKVKAGLPGRQDRLGSE